MLSPKDHPTLLIGALQLVQLLLSKNPEEYRPAFSDGKVSPIQVELLADRTLISSMKENTNNGKEKDNDISDASSAPDLPAPHSPAVATGITVKKEVKVCNALKELAMLFPLVPSSGSAFELLRSGVIDGLLQFATDKTWSISNARRQQLLLDMFIVHKSKALTSSHTPFAIFVKKLAGKSDENGD
ncbi:hypothetical protein EI94DRAFT_1814108 [Lactarius quietus]|nr:hypothetical protein EI94DRAFT_1814108 [Lactarius quietus]